MNIAGAVILLILGYVLGDVIVKNIRVFVVDARKGDEHANGMLMTNVFVGAVIALAVVILVSWFCGCSQLWFFPTFAIAFVINMIRQAKAEDGGFKVPEVNKEFLDHFKEDMEKNAEENHKNTGHK